MRDLLKTLSFSGLHFLVGFTVSYALTGSVAIATGIALIEPTVNTVVFYFHEKAWKKVPEPAPVAKNGPGGVAGSVPLAVRLRRALQPA